MAGVRTRSQTGRGGAGARFSQAAGYKRFEPRPPHERPSGFRQVGANPLTKKSAHWDETIQQQKTHKLGKGREPTTEQATMAVVTQRYTREPIPFDDDRHVFKNLKENDVSKVPEDVERGMISILGKDWRTHPRYLGTDGSFNCCCCHGFHPGSKCPSIFALLPGGQDKWTEAVRKLKAARLLWRKAAADDLGGNPSLQNLADMLHEAEEMPHNMQCVAATTASLLNHCDEWMALAGAEHDVGMFMSLPLSQLQHNAEAGAPPFLAEADVFWLECE